MFSGSYTSKLDGKNRFILPAKLRTQMIRAYNHERPHLVMTIGFFNPCLVLMSEEQWEKLGQVEGLDLLNPVVTDSFRLMSMVAFMDLDEVGRITIPDYLKKMAGLGEQVTLLGCRSYIELWDPAKAEDNLRDLQGKASDVMRRLREELTSRKNLGVESNGER
jgi:division/cell wall cluster transcriptional repressor MraZ